MATYGAEVTRTKEAAVVLLQQISEFEIVEVKFWYKVASKLAILTRL